MQGGVRERRQPVGRPAQLLHQRGVIRSDLAVPLLDRRQHLDHGVGHGGLEHAVRLAREIALDLRPILLLDRAIDLQAGASAARLLLIFFSGSSSPLTSAPAFRISASGMTRMSPYRWLIRWPMSRVYSMCWRWSSPTGTYFAS